MKIQRKNTLKNIPDGSYRVRVSKIEDAAGVNKNGKWSALKIRFAYVSEKYNSFFAPSLMLYLIQDEAGPYFKKGSIEDRWMKILSNVEDYSKVESSALIGKEFVATVMTKDKFTNVVELYYQKPKETK